MIYQKLVCLALLASASALQAPASCVSRLPASRVVSAARLGPVRLCDAAVEDAAEVAPAPVAEAPPAPKAKAEKTPLEDLQVGAEVEGTIRSVQSYGAFVDIGAATDALLHVSEISNEFIKDATEKLSSGETIKARIKGIDLEKKQLALTCKDPRAPRQRKPKVDLTEFESADEKAFITGKVNSITDFGAFVTIKEGVDGLVHISQVKEGGVGKVEDELSVGQEVQVRVTSVDKSKRRIALSMLPWTEESERPKRGGGGGFGGDVGFGEADKAFQMTEEELESLAVGDEFASPFEAAFERAAFVQKMKGEKKKFARQLL